MNPLLGPIIEVAGKVFDRVFPDPEKKAQAQLELIKLEQAGELEAVKAQLSAIVTEAASADPWTSRARPSFLYVMYIMILISLPMGVLSAFKPDVAVAIAHGMQAWLAAIPGDLYTLFGVGYLGYTGARSLDKWKGVTK
jgi:ABC-type amino acid transport substrate-binding protein